MDLEAPRFYNIFITCTCRHQPCELGSSSPRNIIAPNLNFSGWRTERFQTSSAVHCQKYKQNQIINVCTKPNGGSRPVQPHVAGCARGSTPKVGGHPPAHPNVHFGDSSACSTGRPERRHRDKNNKISGFQLSR